MAAPGPRGNLMPMPWLAIVLVLGGLILIHEFGHFLAAKRAGVRVEEFSLGFGAKLFSRRWGETEYALRLIPLGGFVRMAGMVPADEAGKGIEPRDFRAKSVWTRMQIIGAGPAMNFVVAILLLALVFWGLGVPDHPTLVVRAVQPGFPAASSGIQPGDRIVAIGGQAVQDWDQLSRTIRANSGRELALEVQRQGRRMVLRVTPIFDPGRGVAVIGIEPVMAVRRLPLAAALWQGVLGTVGVVREALLGLALFLRGRAAVMGPVGIGQEISQASQLGLAHLLLLTAALSANLGLFNLLPVPALDGSRLVFLALEALRGRPVDPRKESYVHLVGFALLLLIMAFVTYHDLVRLSVGG